MVNSHLPDGVVFRHTIDKSTRKLKVKFDTGHVVILRREDSQPEEGHTSPKRFREPSKEANHSERNAREQVHETQPPEKPARTEFNDAPMPGEVRIPVYVRTYANERQERYGDTVMKVLLIIDGKPFYYRMMLHGKKSCDFRNEEFGAIQNALCEFNHINLTGVRFELCLTPGQSHYFDTDTWTKSCIESTLRGCGTRGARSKICFWIPSIPDGFALNPADGVPPHEDIKRGVDVLKKLLKQ